MRILIINWRSIKDPMEGGAERATFEFAKRWVKNHNAEVTWLSPTYDPKINQEIIEGIKFEYIGIPLSRNIFWLLISFPYFYFAVIFRYFKKFRGNVDVVIDQVHGIPYLTPLYVKEKIVVYIHEVAGEIWKIMYPFPINYLGIFAEKLIFWIYKIKKIKFITNPSTYKDLIEKLGIKKENIKIISYGVTAPHISFQDLPKKEKNLTVVYLNRIVKMKGIERGIKAFSLVTKKFPEAKLWIIGKGEPEYIKELKVLLKEKFIEDKVLFYGFLNENEKYELLGKAHVLINPSYLEGFGLVNIEANKMGTPAAVFDVKGCRDSVKNNINGLLSPDDDLNSMAENIISIYKNKNISKSSWEYSQRFDWDLLEKEFLEEL